MRKLILAICLIMGLHASAIEVTVDENVEFVSAMCRLAGFEEYVFDINKKYVAAIDSMMAPFKDSKAVARLNELRGAQGLSYDAVATFATHTAISDGHFTLRPGSDLAKYEHRWRTGQDAEMARLMDDVYRRCGFHAFYVSQQPFYSKVVANAKSMVSNVDLKWLEDFFGGPIHGHVAVSLLNYGNYGTTLHCGGLPEESVVIIGCSALDKAGVPVFHNLESLMVHEFSHPACNPIIGQHMQQFNGNAQLTAELMKEELRKGAYSGGGTVLRESMVRGVEVQYALAHATTADDSLAVETTINSQVAGGFLFFRELTDALSSYRQNRSQYATLAQFAPKIVETVNNADVKQNYLDLRRNQIKIIGTSLPKDARDVPASDRLEVKVYFDKPNETGGFGLNYYKGNENIMPDIAGVKVDNDRRIMSVTVKTEPGREYGFEIPGWVFRTKAGYPGLGNAVFHFFTAK